MSVVESVMGRSGGYKSVKREYYAFGYASETAAVAAVHADAACPSYISSLPRDNTATQAEEITPSVDPGDLDTTDWRVVVNWGLSGGSPQTGLNYSFSIGGGSYHMNSAIAQTEYDPAGDTAPEVNGAINDDGERVHGISVPTQPAMEFTIEARKTAGQVTNAYLTTVSDLVYKTNVATFEGWAAKEVLFMGLTGSRTGDDEFVLNYKFGRRENVASDTVAGVTISYNGWDYVWVRWKDKFNAANNQMDTVTAGVYVASVHSTGDFSGLAL